MEATDRDHSPTHEQTEVRAALTFLSVKVTEPQLQSSQAETGGASVHVEPSIGHLDVQAWLSYLLEQAHDEGPQSHALAGELRMLSDLGDQAEEDPGGRTCRDDSSPPVNARWVGQRPITGFLIVCTDPSGRHLHDTPGVVAALPDDDI